jgi:hypothetical protein
MATFTYKNSRGATYYLHSRSTPLASGKNRQIFFFSKNEQEGAMDKVPEGYYVSETPNGLPVLRKKENK